MRLGSNPLGAGNRVARKPPALPGIAARVRRLCPRIAPLRTSTEEALSHAWSLILIAFAVCLLLGRKEAGMAIAARANLASSSTKPASERPTGLDSSRITMVTLPGGTCSSVPTKTHPDGPTDADSTMLKNKAIEDAGLS